MSIDDIAPWDEEMARHLHPSGFDTRDMQAAGRRRDLVVVPCRRPVNETVEQAYALGIHIDRTHQTPPAAVYAELLTWRPDQWAAAATAAGQPRPTSAVIAVVLDAVRRATEMDS